MRILAIDPSLASSGLALFEEDGVLKGAGRFVTTINKKTPTLGHRLEAIHDFFENMIIGTSIGTLVLEEPHIDKRNPKTGMLLSNVRGVLLMLAAKEKIEVVSFQPSVVKHAMCGPRKGNASKQEVFDAVMEYYSHRHPSIMDQAFPHGFVDDGKFKNDDISDAIAIGHTYMLYQQSDDAAGGKT